MQLRRTDKQFHQRVAEVSSCTRCCARALLLATVACLFISSALAQDLGLAWKVALLPSRTSSDSAFTFKNHPLHPDLRFQPYSAGALLGDAESSTTIQRIKAFRELLDLYATRQGEDDNFTIRVSDERSWNTLEVVVLDEERRKFERSGRLDWEEVDKLRRRETRRLVEKWTKRGVPRSAIAVKWGRQNQIRDARERDLPYLFYEMRLAEAMGLSLLATEIGTVETFNDDRLVSSVGARGRYQMMPAVLRRNDLHRYTLRTAAKHRVSVAEEWHPLLTMEPAFIWLKGYANAVGHEIPGLSAYHAGPGNIFKAYRDFMAHKARFGPASNVVDAYVWTITDGFDTVSRGSSFGSYSRGYIPSLYGSLRAVEAWPVDFSQTVVAERVQLKPGKSIYLGQLLRKLGTEDPRLSWSDGLSRVGAYDRFRLLNPHFNLPTSQRPGVPVAGDVRLVSSIGGVPVRFFLPLGASEVLRDAGFDLLDLRQTERFDWNTYPDPLPEKTTWDHEYDALVQDIGLFGFTRENRARLQSLANQFERLAEAKPTPFRLRQLDVIRIHKGVWQTSEWEHLASTTARATAGFPPRPPIEARVPIERPKPMPPATPPRKRLSDW